MGQTGSACCCGGGDRRSSSVLNDALQEKLLGQSDQGESKAASEPADVGRPSRKQSASREARVTLGMMSLGAEGSEDDTIDGSRDRIDELEDTDDDDGDDGELKTRTTKTRKLAQPQLSSSYRASSNAWDLSQGPLPGQDSELSLQELGLGGEELTGNEDRHSMAVLQRLESNNFTRDSYASSRETMDSFDQANDDGDDGDGGEDATGHDAAQDAVLRRRSLARPSSSRVFDDDNTGRGSISQGVSPQEGHDQGFGSFGSDSSSMRSFLARDSVDLAAGTSFYHTQYVRDDLESPVVSEETSEKPTEQLIRTLSKSKKKTKKKR